MSKSTGAADLDFVSAAMALRARPAMYFGVGRDDPALAGILLATVVADAVREAPVGDRLRIDVTVVSDLVFRVADDGPGMPDATQMLTQFMTGDVRHGPRGMNLAMVTALCSAVVVDVRRKGRHVRQWANWRYPQPSVQQMGRTDSHGTTSEFYLDTTYLAGTALPTDVAAFLTDPSLRERGPEFEIPQHVDLSVSDHRSARRSRG